jgi:small subunit ribosomal protein S1
MTNILDKLADEVDKIDESNISQPTQPIDDKPEEEVSVMSQLLDQTEIKFPQVGDVIKGKIIEISSNEMYLDLAPFGTGVVMGKEIKDGMGSGKLKIGDEVSATLIDLENEDGYIELSIREASQERAWDNIESKRDVQESVTTKITSVNKGGLLVEINGISGFLPVSQLSSKNYPRVEDGDKNKILQLLKKLQGQELTVRIIDADRETGKLIVSEKAAQSDKDKEVISALTVGDIVDGEVSGVVDFGAFVKFLPKNATSTADEEKLEGLVHISELAWQLIENPRNIIKVGDRVKAKIIGIDADKISLSVRALQTDPWSEIDEKYKIGDTVKGTVNKLNHFGAFVYLDENIHGLAHISEMSQAFPGKNLEELLKVGEKYDWKILSIEPKEHRMGLILISGKTKKKSENSKEEAVPEKEEKPKKPKTAKKEPKEEK